VTPPKAYRLAESQTPRLRTAYAAMRAALHPARRIARLKSLLEILRSGQVAINTSLSTCLKILQGGSILTAHEVAERETGVSGGPAFDMKLAELLGKFHRARLNVEQMYCFDGRAKYGYIHVGGQGPNYGRGACRIILEKQHPYKFSTCYVGDTITAVFDKAGNLTVKPEQALHRFSTRQQLPRLASVWSRGIIEDGLPEDVLDEDVLGDVLSEKATLLEVHIHDQVLLDNIKCIHIAKSVHRSIASRLRGFRSASADEQKAMQYDDVQLYLDIHYLAQRRGLLPRGRMQ
jgi:hypothetical protein